MRSSALPTAHTLRTRRLDGPRTPPRTRTGCPPQSRPHRGIHSGIVNRWRTLLGACAPGSGRSCLCGCCRLARVPQPVSSLRLAMRRPPAHRPLARRPAHRRRSIRRVRPFQQAPQRPRSRYRFLPRCPTSSVPACKARMPASRRMARLSHCLGLPKFRFAIPRQASCAAFFPIPVYTRTWHGSPIASDWQSQRERISRYGIEVRPLRHAFPSKMEYRPYDRVPIVAACWFLGKTASPCSMSRPKSRSRKSI